AMQRIGKVLGCEASKMLMEVPTSIVMDRFEGIVESGAKLGVWSRERGASHDLVLEVLTEYIQLPVKQMTPVDEARDIAELNRSQLRELLNRQASAEEIRAITYQVKRADRALVRSEQYYGKTTAEVELHV